MQGVRGSRTSANFRPLFSNSYFCYVGSSIEILILQRKKNAYSWEMLSLWVSSSCSGVRYQNVLIQWIANCWPQEGEFLATALVLVQNSSHLWASCDYGQNYVWDFGTAGWWTVLLSRSTMHRLNYRCGSPSFPLRLKTNNRIHSFELRRIPAHVRLHRLSHDRDSGDTDSVARICSN